MNKWAIIGMGFIYPRHKQAIESLGDEISFTCDIDKKKDPMFVDWRDMMQSPGWENITHVAVLTPNHLHYEICKAMDGKTVLCEKPLALTEEQALRLGDNVNTVLQLRHHPKVVAMKHDGIKANQVLLKVIVKRDLDYWTGWKGQDNLSGGIVFNLGIHYIDLLIHLFGEDYKIINSSRTNDFAMGRLKFGDTEVKYRFEIRPTNEFQERTLLIDGKEVKLSNQDNLSYEDLHKKVHQQLKLGYGIKPKDAARSIKLAQKLKNVL